MKSMTGHGRGEGRSADGSIFNVEIGSVNRKQLDIRVILPPELTNAESEVRRLVAARISRGNVSVRVSVHLNGKALNRAAKINESLAQAYLIKARSLRDRLEIGGELTIAELMALPGVVDADAAFLDLSEGQDGLTRAANAALDAFDAFRETEGECLRDDMLKRLKQMETLVNQIEPLAAALPEARKAALLKRLEEADLPLNADDERVLREVVIYVDRVDVTEELTRLRAHFKQFRGYLGDGKESPGRSVDFLLQEIQREINTLGVKAADTEITPLVVRFKTEAEKIREQAQNLE